MNCNEAIAKEIEYMYYAIFLFFFGENSIDVKPEEVRKHCRVFTFPRRQSVESLLRSVSAYTLAKIHIMDQEELRDINRFDIYQNSKTKELIPVFKKILSQIEQRKLGMLKEIFPSVSTKNYSEKKIYDNDIIEKKKEKLLSAIDPKYLVCIHLYMKYHKVFDLDLFNAFCDVILTEQSCSINEGIDKYCLMLLTLGEKIIPVIFKQINKSGLYDEVYSDFIKICKEYPSFKVYMPNKNIFSSAVNKIVNEKKTSWTTTSIKTKSNGQYYQCTIDEHKDKLVTAIKDYVIPNLETESGQSKNGEPNQRTIKEKFKEFIYLLKLGQLNYISRYPDFITLNELWELCLEYGVKGYGKRKIADDTNAFVNKRRVILFGRLYVIILLCYAFYPNNFTEKSDIVQEFTTVIDTSLNDENIRDLLKTYCVLSDKDNNTDKKNIKIIKEIL